MTQQCANCCLSFNADDPNSILIVDINLPCDNMYPFYSSSDIDLQPKSQDNTNRIHVQSVLSSVYKLNYLNRTDHSQSEQCQDIGLCVKCCQTATHMFMFFNEFNQLRHVGSYLETKIKELDEFIQSVQCIDVLSNLKSDSASCTKSSPDCKHYLNNLSPSSGPWVKLDRLSPQQVRAAASLTSERFDKPNDLKAEEDNNIGTDEDENADYEPNEEDDEISNSSSITSSNYQDNDGGHLVDIVIDSVQAVYDDKDISSRVDAGDVKLKVCHRNKRLKAKVSNKSPKTRMNRKVSSPNPSKKIQKPALNNSKTVRVTRNKATSNLSTTFVSLNCPLCTEKLSKLQDMKQHLLTHLVEDCTSCPVCFEDYSETSQLKKHVQSHAIKDRECSICGKNFKTEYKLLRHMKSHDETGTPEKEYQKKSMSVDCHHCTSKFSSLCEFRQHYTTQHPGLYPFHCSITDCDRVFFFEKQLKNHEATHNKDKKCLNCHKLFENEDELTQHMESCQTTVGFPCPECGKLCSKKYLKEHLKIHAGQREECQICHKTFSSSNSLRTHAQVHTGNKNFTCHLCLMSFSQSGHLKGHIRSVHAGIKNYTCEICGMAFARAYGLKRHTLRHGEERAYKCTFSNCDKFFKDIETRRNHEVIHGEKKSLCSFCGKAFFAVSNLARHLRLHTGDRPYKCTFISCGGCFIDARQLKKHIIAHHSNNQEQHQDLNYVIE